METDAGSEIKIKLGLIHKFKTKKKKKKTIQIIKIQLIRADKKTEEEN